MSTDAKYCYICHITYVNITDVGFVYQSMEELAKEDSTSDATQEYETDVNIMEATLTGKSVPTYATICKGPHWK